MDFQIFGVSIVAVRKKQLLTREELYPVRLLVTEQSLESHHYATHHVLVLFDVVSLFKIV